MDFFFLLFFLFVVLESCLASPIWLSDEVVGGREFALFMLVCNVCVIRRSLLTLNVIKFRTTKVLTK